MKALYYCSLNLLTSEFNSFAIVILRFASLSILPIFDVKSTDTSVTLVTPFALSVTAMLTEDIASLI